MPEWFEEWFGEEYLQLYPHRDDADAERVVALIRRVLPWGPGWRVLDVGCGAGRHARALEAAGAHPVGLDLSARLLQRARCVTRAPLIRADMRALPVRPRSMDLTVNLFTSFGYFDRDEEHAAVVREMADTVRPGGWFVLDFLNSGKVRAGLAPGEHPMGSGATATRRLSADERFVHKTIRLADGRTFEERVRLFEPADLERMLAAGGVDITHRFGDYDGGSLHAGSPRAVLLGKVA
ncbi:MAG TPA: methyltransferase domain-containing protein [Gemmatimonadales bacterium]|nr:methyltransferase domain-containing protein [Gemmatimonadales bacterium]